MPPWRSLYSKKSEIILKEEQSNIVSEAFLTGSSLDIRLSGCISLSNNVRAILGLSSVSWRLVIAKGS